MVKDPVRLCVVGSINMDLVTTSDNMPNQGETVLGHHFATYPGGKGANQAMAAARLGADVSLVGAMGDDAFGNQLREHFKNEGIQIDGIETFSHESTGLATIIVTENDNRIIVTSGANEQVTPELVDRQREIILNSDIILLQFEIPMETIVYVAELAKEHGIQVIVNPAPYQEMPKELLNTVSYFTPNEIELASMAHLPLFESVKEKMIVTKGSDGVQYWENGFHTVPSYQVDVKDTTGAGDTFNGAFAKQLVGGATLKDAVSYANAAAALSITKRGAQGGMPTETELKQFLNKQSM